jgi:two-component system, response regulator, stage 0 sporulation protein F
MPVTAPLPTILVVEDEPDILLILRRMVRDLTSGHDIVAVRDGATALAEASQRSVSLLITDYHMAGMNGLALATQLKQRTPAARIAMITAYDTPELRNQARACGVDYYLPKPFPFEAFMQIVQDVLP